MRHILSNSELIILFLVVILSVYLVGGVSTNYAPATTNSFTAFGTILSPTPGPSPKPGFGIQMQSLGIAMSAGVGLHGAFLARTPSDVIFAAQHGISYIIQYGDSDRSLDETTDLGKAFAQYNIKAYINIYGNSSDSGYIHESGGTCFVLHDQLKAYVTNVMKKNNLGGYWTKDDSNFKNNCSNLVDTLQQVHDDIRLVDTDPSHLIMAGYGDWKEMGHGGHSNDYSYTISDIVALYPYWQYAGQVNGVQEQVNFMTNVMSTLVPTGSPKKPFIGVYQAFYRDPSQKPNLTCATDSFGPPPWDGIKKNLDTFLKAGAVGINAFSISNPCDVNRVAGNDEQMAQIVTNANQWLLDNASSFAPQVTPSPSVTQSVVPTLPLR